MGPLAEGENWRVDRGDCVEWLASLPEGAADLVFCSPPYEQARLYLEGGEDLGIARDTEEWVAWMVQVCHAARRACKGLCAFVVEGQTDGYRYSCSPYLLIADLSRAGFNLRRPCVYRRSGIPGSGGPDWFRCDHEPVVCFTRPGRLPWSDPTACGHPPKWAPGGEMSHRLSDGTRRNAWGMNGSTSRRKQSGEQQKMVSDAVEESPLPVCPNRQGVPNADKTGAARRVVVRKTHTKAKPSGADERQSYAPPVLANPGTVVQRLYTAEEVAEMSGVPSDVVDCTVGGGQMGEGDRFARQNEAPFPEELPERFIRSFCPPGGLVVDPFSGSGTTGAVSVRLRRRFLGCDLRQSQVDLSRRRISEQTPLMFGYGEESVTSHVRSENDPAGA